MHQPRNANARRNMGNAPGTIDMYVVISEISSGGRSQSALHRHEIMGRRGDGRGHRLCLIITTNEIVHNIGVPDAFCNLFLVANVPFLPSKTIIAGVILFNNK